MVSFQTPRRSSDPATAAPTLAALFSSSAEGEIVRQGSEDSEEERRQALSDVELSPRSPGMSPEMMSRSAEQVPPGDASADRADVNQEAVDEKQEILMQLPDDVPLMEDDDLSLMPAAPASAGTRSSLPAIGSLPGGRKSPLEPVRHSLPGGRLSPSDLGRAPTPSTRASSRPGSRASALRSSTSTPVAVEQPSYPAQPQSARGARPARPKQSVRQKTERRQVFDFKMQG